MKSLLAALLVGALGVLPAAAQTSTLRCLDTEKLREGLKTRFHEEIVAAGIVNAGTATVVYASPGGDTYTIVNEYTTGKSCVIATGEFLAVSPLPKRGEAL